MAAKTKKEKTSEANLSKLIGKFSAGTKQEIMSTGSIVIDKLLGGGYPRGSIIEIGGGPGIGKTTIVLTSVRSICDNGGRCAYLDFEGGVNANQLEGIGLTKYVENGQFIVLYPQTFRDLEESLDTLLEENFDLIAVDSDTAVVPQELLEKSIEDLRPGRHSQLVGELMRKYSITIRRHNAVIVLVSQVRVALNFRGISTVKVAGGNGKQHFAHVRLQLRELKKVTAKRTVMGVEKETQVGSDVEIWANKNRYAPPFVKAPVRVMFGKGVDNVASLMVWLQTHADENGEPYIYTKSNGWTTINWNEETKQLRSENDVNSWVREHLSAVLHLIESKGGYEIMEPTQNTEFAVAEDAFDEEFDSE